MQTSSLHQILLFLRIAERFKYYKLKLALQLPATKRNVLKITTMFYNPLGLVSLVVLQWKLIYLSLCKEKIDWDTFVPESIRNVCDKSVETLRHSEKIIILRLLFVT